jgi:hypothetical protein
VADKLPQPTDVLAKRLRRLARALDKEQECFHTPENKARFQAWANTCWQSAARLDDLMTAHGGDVELVADLLYEHAVKFRG